MVEVKDNRPYSSYKTSLSVTPYNNFYWKKTVELYGVKVPNIVDRTMGISTCIQCGAKYTGNQLVCEKIVTFHESGGFHGPTRGYHSHYKNVEKECDGSLQWSLQTEFDTQVRFFGLMETIRFLMDPSCDPLVEFEKNFPAGVIPDLKTRMLEYKLQKLEMSVGSALSQIASKMSGAGACLSFNA
jgi:hypothetical protein